MSEAEETPDAPPKGGKKKRMIMIAGLFVLGAAGGFGLVKLGILDSVTGGGHESAAPTPLAEAHGGHSGHGGSSGAPSFVEVPTVVVNLPRSSGHTLLRFTMKLEVAPGAAAEVSALEPRILDVLNTYLRAIDPDDFNQPQSLNMIRGHILARMQIVAGSDRVNDVLVQEFVLN